MAKKRHPVPARVRRFVNQIADDYRIPRPHIDYVTGGGGGRARRGWMRLAAVPVYTDGTYGKLPWKDLKALIAHESAHGIAPVASHHDAKFWKIFWELVKRYRVDYATALRSTAYYKVEGIRQAALAEIPGAQALLDTHQRSLNEGTGGTLGEVASHNCIYADPVRIEPPQHVGWQRQQWWPTWRVVRECVKDSYLWGQFCSGTLATDYPTEGQARAAMFAPPRRKGLT